MNQIVFTIMTKTVMTCFLKVVIVTNMEEKMSFVAMMENVTAKILLLVTNVINVMPIIMDFQSA